MAKGCVYILQTGKDAGKVFGSKESLAAHMNYTPAMADLMAKYQQAGGAMDVGNVTKWLTDNGYLKAEGKAAKVEKPQTGKTSEKDGQRLSGFKKGDVVYRNYNGRYEEYTIADTSKDVWKLVSPEGRESTWNAANNEGFMLKETKADTKPVTKTAKEKAVKKEFPKAPVTDAVKAALKSVDNTTVAIMNLAKVLPTVYESITKQVKTTLGKPVSQQVAEAYHNAVENGVEPELVAAVENAVALQEQMKSKPSLADDIETAETLEMEGVPNGVRVSNKASMADLERKHAGNATKKATIAMARAAAKTLKSVFPMMDIHLHENSSDYNNTMAGLGAQQNSAGNFTYSKSADGTVVGRIDINLNRAVPRTVVHEVSHAIMLKTFGDSSPAFLEFRNNLEKIISKSGNARLSAFADKYKDIADDIGQAEEYLAELAGILSDKEAPLSYGVIRRIAEMINKVVSTITFGRLKPFEDLQNQKETLEFFNTMAQNIKAGQEYDINSMGLHGEIKATGVKSKASISSGEIMGFEVNPNTKVEDDVPLSRVNGKVTNLIESDRMVGGYIADKEGNPLFKFFGGVKFPEITGKWWASRTNSKAKGIAQNANKNRDADGYIYSSPMIGSEKQHMSNADMMFTTIELMKEDVKNKKSKVTKADVVEIMNKALDRKKIAEKRGAFKSFFKAKNIVDMFEELEFILFQEGMDDPNAVKPAKGEKKEKEKKYLADRNGNLMLTEEGNKVPVFSFEDRLTIVQTLLGDPKVKEPRFPMAGSITDTAKRFTEPVSGRAEKIGDVVMVMRTKGTLKHKKTPTTDEFYHRSYPYEIYAVNEDGTPAEIEVFFLDGAYSMQDVLPELKKSNGDMFSYKEYAEKHAAKTQTYVEAQYNRTAKLAYASGKIKSKAQIFGETGAARMENAEKVLDNLQVARDMEAKFEKEERTMTYVGPSKATENAQKIRLATGWERGADGMWRLEIPDGQLKPIDLDNMYKDGGVPKAYLDEIYDSKELYDAYPTARDIRVSFVEADDFKGAYNKKDREIELAINNFDEPMDMLSTLLHEVQHYIQYEEGFATGSSTSSVVNKALSELKLIREQMESVKNEMKEPGADVSNLQDKQAALEGKYKRINQQITNVITDARKRMNVELKGLAEQRAFVDMALRDSDVRRELYVKAAGEVEARNVQKRMGLSEEERMNKLLSSTEDVLRSDQLVLGAALKGETPTLKSKAQIVYDETGFITTDSMIEIVGANDPTYLGDVMNHILDMGEKLRSGNVGPKDLAKAYMMAVSSIRSGDLGIAKFENAIGQKVDEVFVEKERGKIRTEGAMAYLLTTPQGERMLNNISNGKIDAKDRAFISQAMKPFGMFGEGESKFDNLFGAPSNKQINLTNINEFADMLKGGVKNEQELFNAIANLKGISQAKVGFVSNFLGIGTRGVIDAREIQGWMRGVVFQGERTEKEAALEKELLKSNKNLTPLQKEILRRMKVVGDAFNVEPIISEYIGHHMIWDAVKNERTTHDGLYLAMKQNEDDFNNRLAEIKAKPEIKTKPQLADNNAKEVADLYAQMREGGGWAERQKINAILDQDPKLSYIYNNFKAITQMLEDAKLLTKSGNCP